MTVARRVVVERRYGPLRAAGLGALLGCGMVAWWAGSLAALRSPAAEVTAGSASRLELRVGDVVVATSKAAATRLLPL